MAQAYDFALDKIGMEIMSYQVCKSEQCIFLLMVWVFFKLLLHNRYLLLFQIWVDYINFLKGV